MNEFNKEIHQVFGNKLRVRVSGICIQNDQILLVKHLSLGTKGIFWAPPGGGMEFGESAEESLIREFKEETGLDIKINQFLFINEFMEPPLHSVELFFEVGITGGQLKKGKDPEMSENKQIIDEVRFLSFEELNLIDKNMVHNMFKLVKNPWEIRDLKGYYLDRK
jgi:8-oxo-dGTP diphosphatase